MSGPDPRPDTAPAAPSGTVYRMDPRYTRSYDPPPRRWDELAGRLWVGGHDHTLPGRARTGPDLADFDLVATFDRDVAADQPASGEIVWPFDDGDVDDPDGLSTLAAGLHRRWQTGETLLLRCAAGQNRAPLVAALVLLADGWTPGGAVAALRTRRHPSCLHNDAFVDFLHGPAPALLARRG